VRLAPAGVVGVLSGDATLMDTDGAGDVGSRALVPLLAPPHAVSAPRAASAAAVAVRCMWLA
jgi:hypothetical protein